MYMPAIRLISFVCDIGMCGYVSILKAILKLVIEVLTSFTYILVTKKYIVDRDIC